PLLSFPTRRSSDLNAAVGAPDRRCKSKQHFTGSNIGRDVNWNLHNLRTAEVGAKFNLWHAELHLGPDKVFSSKLESGGIPGRNPIGNDFSEARLHLLPGTPRDRQGDIGGAAFKH